MEFIERVACWVYVRSKLAFLMGRFPGQIAMTKAFRRPFYCRVSATGYINVAERTSFNYGCVLIAHERIDIGKGLLVRTQRACIRLRPRHGAGWHDVSRPADQDRTGPHRR